MTPGLDLDKKSAQAFFGPGSPPPYTVYMKSSFPKRDKRQI